MPSRRTQDKGPLRVYVSYSHKDRDTARKIVEDLEACGASVWFDEHRIRVGDSIPARVSEGLRQSDYVVLLISKHSMNSHWVRREWLPTITKEIDARKSILLPALLEDCEIDDILRDKLYADFRASYWVGLSAIVSSLSEGLLREHCKRLRLGSGGSILTAQLLERIYQQVRSGEGSPVVPLLDTLVYSIDLTSHPHPEWLEGDWAPVEGWGVGDFSRNGVPLSCTKQHHEACGNTLFGTALCSFGKTYVNGVVEAAWKISDTVAVFSWSQDVGNDMLRPATDGGFGFLIAKDSFTRLAGLWWFCHAWKVDKRMSWVRHDSAADRSDHVKGMAYIWRLDRMSYSPSIRD